MRLGLRAQIGIVLGLVALPTMLAIVAAQARFSVFTRKAPPRTPHPPSSDWVSRNRMPVSHKCVEQALANCSTVVHFESRPRDTGGPLTSRDQDDYYVVRTSVGELWMRIDDEVTRTSGGGFIATLEPAVKEVHQAVETCGTARWSATRRTTRYP